ncbi:MAG: M23 family metallopeptidase, partial [Oscillospiraceae bacterium]|nr:M23 family metallopeptidase [Oscillospiraceae bacterium]
KTKLEASQKKQEEKREEADKLLAKLVATGAEYQKLLDKAEENAEKVGDKLDNAKDDLDDAKYQQWLSTSVPTKPTDSATNTVGGKTWLTPCKYVYMSSPFGWRIHPLYGDRRFHYGIDLAASTGTPIVATRSGVVAAASRNSSAGFYVTLDHKDGYTSKYLHMTHYIVSPGQKVSAGQVIGYVGSTGASKGAHLHFSILYKGEHVNPANYIKV